MLYVLAAGGGLAVGLVVAWLAGGWLWGRAKSAEAEVERHQVQLAGISCAAQGHGLDDPAKPGDYGWIVPYDDVLRLRRRYEYAVRRLGISHDELWRDLASEDALVDRTKGDPAEPLAGPAPGARTLAEERDDLDRRENHGEGVQYRVSGERCGFVPPAPGYAPCTRDKGHGGPCAHDLLAVERSGPRGTLAALADRKVRQLFLRAAKGDPEANRTILKIIGGKAGDVR